MEHFDLVFIGGPQAKAAAARAVESGRRVALVNHSLYENTLQRQSTELRRRMIAEGRSSVKASQAAFRDRLLAAPADQSEPAFVGQPNPDGVDAFGGCAVFTGPRALAIHGREYQFDQLILALDAFPTAAAIEGFDSFAHHNQDTWIALDRLPARIAILGHSDEACELAQAFVRSGCSVHLVAAGPVLPEMDVHLIQPLLAQLAAEHVHLHLGWSCRRAEQIGRTKSLQLACGNQHRALFIDEVIVAGSRQCHLDRMGLPIANVQCDRGRIQVDASQRSSNPNVFAYGPAAGDESLADSDLRPIFLAKNQRQRIVITRHVLTDPQIVSLHSFSSPARRFGSIADTFRRDSISSATRLSASSDQGRATIDLDESGRISAATLVGPMATDVAQLLSLAMQQQLPIEALAELALPCNSMNGLVRDLGRQRIEAQAA